MASATALATRISYTGAEKAAIVLLSLGAEASADLMKKFSEEEVAAVGAAMARFGVVSPKEVEGVLEEFHVALETRDVDVNGGLEQVRTLLTNAFGREYATRLLDRVEKSLERDVIDFGNLSRVDPQQLAKFIQEEHPQTIALVLSHLDPTQGAGLLRALSADLRMDVLIRVAGLEQIPPESVRTIATVIGHKLRNLGELSRESCGGVRSVADILNRMDLANGAQLMDAMEKANPSLFENVRRLMFVFEDLSRLDDNAIRELIARVDRKQLAVAMKGTSQELQRQFSKGFSQRGAEMLKEDIESLGPIRIREVDAAQQSIIAVARQLEQEGIISLRSTARDEYV